MTHATAISRSSRKTRYKGVCKIEPQGGGSFYISHPSMSKSIGVDGLMVMIESKDYAVVQAAKKGGGGSI